MKPKERLTDEVKTHRPGNRQLKTNVRPSKKKIVYENLGGQNRVHQTGRESIFPLIFRLQTKFSRNKRNKQTLKVNKANWSTVLSTTNQVLFQ